MRTPTSISAILLRSPAAGLLLLGLCLWLCQTAWAQDLQFMRLDMRNGLPHNQVNTIYKDSHGFVWFGTASGLSRYDGYTFRVYHSRHGDDATLAGNYIDQIVELCDGRMWIRSDDRVYSLYNPDTETFTRDVRAVLWDIGIDGVPNDVYVDTTGTVWYYILGRGLYRYRPDDKAATGPGSLTDDEGHSLTGLRQTALAECTEGMLVVYDNGTVACIDRETLTTDWTLNDIPQSLTDDTYGDFRLTVDRDQDLWIYSSLGTWVYSIAHRRWRPELINDTDRPPTDMVNAIVQAHDGTIWIGKNQEGIDLLDKSTGHRRHLTYRTDMEQGLTANTINALYEDNNGVVWVGTYKRGAAYYAESLYKFGFHTIDDINCIEEDPGHGLWLGTNERGLMHWNAATGETRRYTHGGQGTLSSDVVVCLLRAHDGRLWIGTFMGGLDCFDGQHFTHYGHRPDDPHSLSNNNVWALAEDRMGRIWIGTLGGGLQCLDPRDGSLRTFNMATVGLISNHIASLCITHDDRLVIGTASSGIALLDLKTERVTNLVGTLSGETHFSNQSINQVFEDSQGLLWIATRAGLNLYNPRTDRLQIVAPTTTAGNDFISGITEDENKTLWVTTTTGVISIVPYLSDRAGSYHFDIHTYDDQDGLQSGGFNQRSIRRLNTGEIVIGGMYGLNTLRPGHLKYNQARPHVMFTDFLLFNEPVSPGRKYGGHVVLDGAIDRTRSVSLRYEQNVFTVLFASDDYILPAKTTYAYRLEGFDGDYLYAGADMHRVTYTNLSPGTYRLHVKAINSDGYAGTDEATLRITVAPPLYLTPYAYALYALLLLGAVALIYLYIQRRERHRFLLRQMEQDARQAEELNQMKFRFFTNISHELRTPLTLIISPLEAMLHSPQADNTQSEHEVKTLRSLQMIHRNAMRLLTLVNQLLDFRKSEMVGLRLNLSEGDVVAFVRAVCDSFVALAEKRDVHLTFFSADESLHISFDEDKIGKVVTNLLSNAFKFTPEGGRVDVSLQRAAAVEPGGRETLELRVSDTGIGISDADKPYIFDRFYQAEHRRSADGQSVHPSAGSGIGLSLVSDYVALHGGTVRVLDNVETGTVFVVSLPITPTAESAAAPTVAEPATDTADTGTLHTASPDDRRKPLALIVDDSADLLTFVRDSLSLYFRVITATDGEQAWQRLSTADEPRPDIVVCDVMMPRMDGNELCRRAKAEQSTAHIPIILLSAKGRTEDRLQGLKAGADDYVTKPFNVEMLLLRMRKLIELSRSTRPRTHIDPEPTEIAITSLDEQLVDHAIKYVEQHIGRADLSVEELSTAMGMSRVHLYKKLVRITGKTPIEFIRVIRLKRAAQLLRESQLNISEIAFQLGFNNPKNFTKYFKDEFGVTPSAYQDMRGI